LDTSKEKRKIGTTSEPTFKSHIEELVPEKSISNSGVAA
jgi:hypothetical protein